MGVRETMFGWNEQFSYAVCATCGSLTLPRPPTDLARYYPADYYSIGQDPEIVLGNRRTRPMARLLATAVLRNKAGHGPGLVRLARNQQANLMAMTLESVRRAGLSRGRATRILDVGSGSGFLPFLLGLAGMREVTGIDPFIPADRALSTGCQLLKMDLSEATQEFDLIMFHHSLEHVTDPEGELRSALARLAPQGRILVRMPTCSSHAFEKYSEHWFQIDAPRHLSVPSRDGMERLCDRLGLRVVSVTDDSTGIQFWRSEQARAGLAMADPRTSLTADGDRLFSDQQLADWEHEARRLNRAGRGDQAHLKVAVDLTERPNFRGFVPRRAHQSALAARGLGGEEVLQIDCRLDRGG